MNNQNKIYIHPILSILGFTVLFSFIMGFPFGTFIGLEIGLVISKRNKGLENY
ncbi:hypothetical protein [Staphylococcus warneri]|uniref:hypothetical protein n=1 Tax=Staphylococcus warneri TaxID=1292 RepID=UPI00079B7C65|nr:hypothetical protein [Staphylococcus warneri]KTW19304.1 membrane protein [Staphylococcus warneri]